MSVSAVAAVIDAHSCEKRAPPFKELLLPKQLLPLYTSLSRGCENWQRRRTHVSSRTRAELEEGERGNGSMQRGQDWLRRWRRMSSWLDYPEGIVSSTGVLKGKECLWEKGIQTKQPGTGALEEPLSVCWISSRSLPGRQRELLVEGLVGGLRWCLPVRVFTDVVCGCAGKTARTWVSSSSHARVPPALWGTPRESGKLEHTEILLFNFLVLFCANPLVFLKTWPTSIQIPVLFLVTLIRWTSKRNTFISFAPHPDMCWVILD